MIQFGVIFLAVALLAPGCNNTEKPEEYPENPNTGDKVLVWSDEFDYNGLPDPKKWSYDTQGNASGWGNNELQFYTDSRLKNAEVKDGFLYITAHKESYEGFSYTSARLVTKGKGDWLYGRVEVKAKLPDGRGMWPAIWMLPTDWSYGGWPASGEIDIMENVGYDPYVILGTVHTQAYNHTIGTQKGASTTERTCYSDFHVYALEWDATEIRIYLDELLYFTFKNEGTGFGVWPFDKRFHLLLNVAVGGNWGGQQGVDDSVFPRQMIVDYVRVYQKK
jgi:beta-glucanase (GH16 family)